MNIQLTPAKAAALYRELMQFLSNDFKSQYDKYLFSKNLDSLEPVHSRFTEVNDTLISQYGILHDNKLHVPEFTVDKENKLEPNPNFQKYQEAVKPFETIPEAFELTQVPASVLENVSGKGVYPLVYKYLISEPVK